MCIFSKTKEFAEVQACSKDLLQRVIIVEKMKLGDETLSKVVIGSARDIHHSVQLHGVRHGDEHSDPEARRGSR